eukprot:1045562-Prorocentrum_minimum.AAC.2
MSFDKRSYASCLRIFRRVECGLEPCRPPPLPGSPSPVRYRFVYRRRAGLFGWLLAQAQAHDAGLDDAETTMESTMEIPAGAEYENALQDELMR